MKHLRKIFYLLNYNEKKNFFLLFFLILIMALLETIGVVSILPFIAVLTNPDIIETNSILNHFYEITKFVGVENINDFLFLLGILVFFLLIISITTRSITNFFLFNFTLMLEYSLSKRLIECYLHQPYSWFLNQNSSDLGRNILAEIHVVVNGTMFPLMNLISQVLVTLAILVMLFIVDQKLTIIVGSVLILSYLIIYLLVKNILKKKGIERQKSNESRYSLATEAFNAIKDIKFGGLESTYINNFSSSAKIYAKNVALAQVIAEIPKNFIEAIAFGGVIILILYLMTIGQDIATIIPLIALYAFAGYRLMPALQRIYSALTTLKFSSAALKKLFQDTMTLSTSREVVDDKSSVEFTKLITLNSVSFNYPASEKFSLKNINLSISSKSKVGIIGKTGSGKTTTVDLILGLLKPSQGNIKVDGIIINERNKRAWQKNVGYVPQQIYLSDDTLASNIAFGVNKKDINYKFIEEAARIANLHNYIVEELPEKYNTIIGERGVRLSGGQRQRVGIARALYHNPKIIVFDEATNALDSETEKSVIEAINKLSNKITIIMIAHRLTTVKDCDQIFLFEKGELKDSGNFKELDLNENITNK